MPIFKASGTQPEKCKRIVPGDASVIHYREYPTDEADRRTLKGSERTQAQQRVAFGNHLRYAES